MTLGERIRDHVAEHGVIGRREVCKVFGVSQSSAGYTLRIETDAGVLVQLPGKPHRYRLAYQACPVFGLVGVT